MNPTLCALDGHGKEDANHTIKHSMPGILMVQKAIITGSVSEYSSCPSPTEYITYLTQFHHIPIPGMPFSTLQLQKPEDIFRKYLERLRYFPRVHQFVWWLLALLAF